MHLENAEKFIIPDGEKYKNFETLISILNKASELRLDRKCAFVAFGGGVIGDMTGFAASIYRRGVDFVQIPTTLLAQVDSSVGGKTAVNNGFGKNLIGTFYQPRVVIADTKTLTTLDERQLKTGFAEVVKYAFIEKSCGEDFGFSVGRAINTILVSFRQGATDIESYAANKPLVIAGLVLLFLILLEGAVKRKTGTEQKERSKLQFHCKY